MKKLWKYRWLLLLIVCLFVPFFWQQSASAKVIVQDESNFFLTSDRSNLKNICEQISQKYKISVYIWTNPDIFKSMDYEGEMERFVSDVGEKDVVILFIGTYPGDRVYEVQGYGKCMDMIPSSRATTILDDMENDMRSGSYYSAAKIFCSDVDYYMSHDPKFDSLLFNPLVQLGFCAVIGCLIILPMALTFGKKVTVNDRTYLDENHSGIIGQYERYKFTTTSRVRKPSSSSSGHGHSGGGGGHSSGGGRSF